MTHGFVRRPDGKLISFDPPGSLNTQPSSVNAKGPSQGLISPGVRTALCAGPAESCPLHLAANSGKIAKKGRTCKCAGISWVLSGAWLSHNSALQRVRPGLVPLRRLRFDQGDGLRCRSKDFLGNVDRAR